MAHAAVMWASPIARFVGCRHAQASVVLRKAVQIIVMSVTVVTLPVFIGLLRDAAYTLSRLPSRHRHGYRHRRNALPKRLTRRRDGDDAHDGHLRAYSRQGALLYFVGSLTPST